jgi:hypothetical protein
MNATWEADSAEARVGARRVEEKTQKRSSVEELAMAWPFLFLVSV